MWYDIYHSINRCRIFSNQGLQLICKISRRDSNNFWIILGVETISWPYPLTCQQKHKNYGEYSHPKKCWYFRWVGYLSHITPLKTNMTSWTITIFNRRYIFKCLIFHCHVSFFLGGYHIVIVLHSDLLARQLGSWGCCIFLYQIGVRQ